MPTNYKKLFAIQKKHETDILKICPKIDDKSGIYFLTRTDEIGIRHAYIGQAIKLKSRLISHMMGYTQHIDRSLKSHKLYSEDNQTGWKINFLHYPPEELDKWEQYYIKLYADNGFQLKNKTGGSQGVGKTQISEYRPAKGYRDGVDYGYRKASKEIAHLFSLHLMVSTKVNPPTKNQMKALEKFNDFLNAYKESEIEDGEEN